MIGGLSLDLLFAMSEDSMLEEAIWEYKSKRKLKSYSENYSDDTSKSVPKATGGKYKTRQNRKKNKKGTIENNEGSKGKEQEQGECGSQTSVVSDGDLNYQDDIQLSQDKASTPEKQSRSHNKKQITPKKRPIYDGYCPNCQMPFSLLLIQTPRWHISECLDVPVSYEKECPDGLLCTSTIPSHYKRYSHFLLAQRRAEDGHSGSPANSPELSNHLCNLEKEGSSRQKQIEEERKVPNDPSLITSGPRKAHFPPESNKKTSFSTNTPASQKTLQFPEPIGNDSFECSGLPRASGNSDNQNNPKPFNLRLPETDVSDYEISYSPLKSDEDTYDTDGDLENSQSKLSLTGNSEYSNTNYNDENEHSVGFIEPYTQSALSLSTSQSSESTKFSDLSCATNFLKFPSGASPRELNLSSNYTKAPEEDHDGPKLFVSQSKMGDEPTKDSAVGNCPSPNIARRARSKSLKYRKESSLPLKSTEREVLELSSSHLSDKSNSVNEIKGTMDISQPSQSAIECFSSSQKCDVKSPPSKTLKQMDIGVFFGLPPKVKEEKVRKGTSKGMKNVSPIISPKEQHSRKRKRKADSLSDTEPLTVKTEERSQRQRKRLRESDALEEEVQKTKAIMSVKDLKSFSGNLTKVSTEPARAGSRRWRKRFKESTYTEEGPPKKICPFYKKIPGTGFTVDAFQYGAIDDCTAYFLTHFHSDHYGGLSKKFTYPIYCNKITGNLVKSKLKVQEQYIHILPMDTVCIVNGIKVVLLDANHCPGAVMLLFYLPNGNVILHTGDFRADPSMKRYPKLIGQKIHMLYLDTTYCSPEYSFPSQQEVIQFAANTAFESINLNPHTLVICGTYSIGKEKVFIAIAEVLGSKVSMSQEKYKTLRCLELEEVNSLITTDWSSTKVHLLPMMQITFKGLQSHLSKFGGKYNQVLAFKPTGWTYSEKSSSISDIKPETRGNITIYGIPYSEHSSYLEMKHFVQWLKPQKIIPTVNIGCWKTRNAMEKHFIDWKLEAKH
ncbi:DNA cross-link repair 1A protein [Ornithorhynchus anatinus]|uniref:DNA cross-link repair 1A protein n=1 Tax=Ornithorhynchus anatinus TaxID=9258 RepID=F7F8Q5_ORNAN|nr:DNA cross-link repair 1A protein [Ornithorhynchus anatinus]XP_007665882.2 DNA cross-link repair 1A protein [Ornithorhynchus anatinus]XP_028936511.1 DNA cross-link repair 1A protein [Ornithorhynchus anatinus]XP_028936512.1 DNA cross-link repair 1A protein [Ornithorhynchus anatinus]